MDMESVEIAEYLNLDSSANRLAKLNEIHTGGRTVPISLVNDLLFGNLPPAEQIMLLTSCNYEDKLLSEDVLTRGIYKLNQNVGSVALRLWAKHTDCLLWHRTLPLVFDESISQRLGYTLLDLAWYGAGRHLLERFINLSGLENMSPTFIALVFHTANIWSFQHEKLVDIGVSHITSVNEIGFKGDKVIAPALIYFLRNHPKILDDNNIRFQSSGAWSDIISSLRNEEISSKFLTEYRKIIQKCISSEDKLTAFYTGWPSLWHRNSLPKELIAECLKVLSVHNLNSSPNGLPLYNMFGGIDSKVLGSVLELIEDDIIFCRSLSLLGNLLDKAAELSAVNSLRERIKKSSDPTPLLENIPQKLRIKLHDLSSGSFKQIEEESKMVLNKSHQKFSTNAFVYAPKFNRGSHEISRMNFINTAYCGQRSLKGEASDYWNLLAKNWLEPKENDLDEMANFARKSQSIYLMFYIATLGRFQGVDKATLKLLDFVRSSEPTILSAVISSLASINTERSIQELVAFLSRPNITFELQMDIAQILKERDLTNLQSEIRSAIDDIYVDPHAENMQWELIASLRDLIQVSSDIESKAQSPIGIVKSSPELDLQLAARIKGYQKLSSEAKRALRTAQFFQIQVESSGSQKTIDLSPAIDMQYKALELTFRENFEATCSALINDGILQRKLDLIGYSRPIKNAMDEFENYIEKLPIIKDIPFFSRFKLRKLLRAICQFRRGKRFTLDGLKAFGLFFIVFARPRCNYGLQNLMGAKDFELAELSEFVKALHLFQDFRNRAAHEGFHPEASNNLDAIWENTASIIETMFRFRESLTGIREAHNPNHAAKSA